jgi:hypothetical protein
VVEARRIHDPDKPKAKRFVDVRPKN